MKRHFSKAIATVVMGSMLATGSTAVYGGVNETSIASENEITFSDADNVDSKSPRFKLIELIGIGLTIQDRIAYIYTECEIYEKADISLKAELQEWEEESWKTIKTFRSSESDATFCSLDKSYAVTRNYAYRVKVTVTVDDGNTTEEVVRYSSMQECYNDTNPLEE